MGLTLFRMGFFGAAHRWGVWGRKTPLPKICHTYPTVMKLRTFTPYAIRSKKYMNHVTHPMSSADISIFLSEFSKFWYISEIESLWIVIINMIKILMMSAKKATPGLLKINVFWNKGYYVIYSVYDVTNKILSDYSNYIMDVVMWLKFSSSSICIREVIMTSIW